ncbi:MAG: hypothetical protein AAF387_08235, partial [Pseudomonadota bacterium]
MDTATAARAEITRRKFLNVRGQRIVAERHTIRIKVAKRTMYSGDYVFLIQDTGSSVSYDFDFVASPVPIPAAFGLLLPCLALLIKGRKPVVIA